MQEKELYDAPLVHLKIGECIFTSMPMVINTVLGSCVSMTFFSPAKGFAGMFHAMLPCSEHFKKISTPCTYVNLAVRELLDRFKQYGINPKTLQICLLGGAMSQKEKNGRLIDSILNVGAKNIAQARKALSENHLVPEVELVGGNLGRKILFHTGTGRVYWKYVGQDSGVDIKQVFPPQERFSRVEMI